ncbi:hypothetical protein EVAR_4216_1 [Eumeta japonica]|uniref:Uncharacterized protein n=1 Tax=Eumeta variegata TaxID=151549 RepID=A0A4C1TG55_EUMVA|nr:hypothetical protein EVAR_4216_1 [Eumeta japonica]
MSSNSGLSNVQNIAIKNEGREESASDNIPILSITSIEPSPSVKLPTTCISEPICAGNTVDGNDTINSISIGAQKCKIQDLECSDENTPDILSGNSFIPQPRPNVARLIKGRSAPGRPRLEEQQPELLKAIIDLAMFSASVEERRRSEIVRRSGSNRVERRMAPLSRDLSGLILPHDSYGTHMDEQGKTTDLDLSKGWRSSRRSMV